MRSRGLARKATETVVELTKSRPSKRHRSTSAAPSAWLLDIKPEHDDLVRATVLARPSVRNKSPYVGDIELADGRVAVAHMPSMDMGGKCHVGATMLLKPARDAKGKLIGGDAVGKFGTPKCEFIAQLLWVSDPPPISIITIYGHNSSSGFRTWRTHQLDVGSEPIRPSGRDSLTRFSRLEACRSSRR